MIARFAVLFAALVMLYACARRDRRPLEDLSGHEDLSRFTIQSEHGLRDGDKLAVQVVISDSSSILTLDLHFAVGSPTRLDSGTWRWSRNNQVLDGSIAARSVMFLGGQDGPPSIGGTFDLLDSAGVARYRVTIPTTALPEHWQARPATN